MNKSELRKKLKADRAVIAQSDWQLLSDDIQQNCISLLRTFQLRSVFTYLESERSREVSTAMIIDFCRSKSVDIYIPKTKDDGTMKPVFMDENCRLETNKWGIPEPDEVDLQTDVELNVAIVPLLGCDTGGNRIGYGKGYYDRFLKRYPDIISIGLCPDFALLKSVPFEQHDVSLKYVVTESRVIRI